MNREKKDNKLTIMMVPHNGKHIRSIELTSPFFILCGVFVLTTIFSTAFLSYKYISTKNILKKNIAYIEEKTESYDQLQKNVQQTSEWSNKFTKELSRTESLFRQASLDNNAQDYSQIRNGDFAQALDISSQNYTGGETQPLINLTNQLESNLPLLENINSIVESQQKLFKDIPVFWPVPSSLISMEWGPNIHPVYGSWYIHKGIDLAALPGTPVLVAADGEVTFVGYDKGYGLHIYVTHKYGFKTHYSHLSAIKVTKGQKVSQGKLIGNVGSTGLVTGPHLDFQLYLGNELVDPGIYLRVLSTYQRPQGNR